MAVESQVDALRNEIKKDGFDWQEDGPELITLIDIHLAVMSRNETELLGPESAKIPLSPVPGCYTDL